MSSITTAFTSEYRLPESANAGREAEERKSKKPWNPDEDEDAIDSGDDRKDEPKAKAAAKDKQDSEVKEELLEGEGKQKSARRRRRREVSTTEQEEEKEVVSAYNVSGPGDRLSWSTS